MKKRTVFSLLATAALLFACFWCWHLHSLYAEAAKLQDALSEKNLLVKKIDALRSYYPDIEAAKRAEAAACKRWRQKLPDQIEADAFIKALCQEAQKNSLNIININTNPADDRQSLIVNLELNGDFSSFLAFLKALEKMPRFNESDVFRAEKTGAALHFFIATRIFSLG